MGDGCDDGCQVSLRCMIKQVFHDARRPTVLTYCLYEQAEPEQPSHTPAFPEREQHISKRSTSLFMAKYLSACVDRRQSKPSRQLMRRLSGSH